MSDRAADEQFMQHALDLARQGVGLASPNPCVGAVIVGMEGNVVGTGIHTYDGVKHAEVLALERVGERARGATLYINLEPCSHQGRTPPCADALIAAGIRRVVASMLDPNPAVAGRGFEKLRAAGIQVEIGALAEQARRLNESFARYIRSAVPLVTLKSAMTLDAKIAPSPAPQDASNQATGAPRGGWITGEAARAHVQRLRHANDALMVGIGTVLADDPLLTDRSGLPRRRPLLRVVLDSQLRIPLDSRIVQSAKDGDVLVFCAEAPKEKAIRLKDLGVRVETFDAHSGGQVDLHEVLRRLGQLQITSLMIEGGSQVNGEALAVGIVDKVFLYYAPTILGEPGAVPFTTRMDLNGSSFPLRIKSVRVHRFEEDVAVEGYIRDPNED
jgi:diaminohydroxyphosphoribosylaminopyrimidine deaminase / 5-amino-6-(5-phosphoribosylamino)uracil reductase